MMTKERLRAYRHLKYETEQIKAQLDELETRMCSPKGQRFTSMPHNPSSNGRTMEDLVAVHMKLVDLYADRLAELEAEQIEVETAINALPSPERQVLRARYISGLSWEKVCTVVHYEWTHVHRIHASGLRMLQQ